MFTQWADAPASGKIMLAIGFPMLAIVLTIFAELYPLHKEWEAFLGTVVCL